MPSTSDGPYRGVRASGSYRRPRRAAIVLLTLLVVILAAVAVPWVLSGQSAPASVPSAPSPSRTAGTLVGLATPPPGTATPFDPAPTTFLPGGPTPTSTFVPIETPPVSVGVVATRIRIDRLQIDLPVVEGDGVDAPLYKAAHYPGTAWPRGGSNTYIYGHAQPKMFLSLWDAKAGDEVVLDLVDGTQAVYIVDQVIPQAPWDDLALLDPTPVEQLTLQTSTSNHATSPRFVVIAHPKP
jgi:LPXTG-site transpeptidase (sortase) family protein